MASLPQTGFAWSLKYLSSLDGNVYDINEESVFSKVKGLTSSSFSLCIRGVKRKLSTSTANGGCQSWKTRYKCCKIRNVWLNVELVSGVLILCPKTDICDKPMYDFIVYLVTSTSRFIPQTTIYTISLWKLKNVGKKRKQMHKSKDGLSELTIGGLILQIPDFSAIGRILAMYPSGSRNSSHDGSNTGHSGGGTNSSGSIALATENYCVLGSF